MNKNKILDELKKSKYTVDDKESIHFKILYKEIELKCVESILINKEMLEYQKNEK